MKKSRKILALLLSLALTLGVSVGAFAAEGPGGPGGMPGGPGGPGGMPGGGSAADPGASVMSQLKDSGSIANQDDVSMLMGLRIVGGTKVNDEYLFNAAAGLTRAEAAKMVALASTVAEPDAIKGDAKFDDTEGSWAEKYIAYCVDKGYASASGSYNPDGTVTAAELGAMMEAAVGASGLDGSEGEGAITRDTAAKIVASALKTSGKVVFCTETTENVTVPAGAVVAAPAGKLATLVVDGKEAKDGTGTVVVTEDTGYFGSFNNEATYPFRTAVYVDGGKVVAEKSVTAAVDGTYEDALTGTVISATDDFSAVLVNDSDYTIKGATITANTAADGQKTNDFSGLGAAVMAVGDSLLTIDDTTIETTGVAKLAMFSDDGADVVVKNSTLKSNSGTIWEGYMSTADQSIMVAPPWVLGIGGNARTTNLMGDLSTSTFVDSTVHAKDWGALSTDSGSWMHLTAINTDVIVDETGYGAYDIGEATEDYYGTRFDVETMAIIMTGGHATLQSYTGGQSIDIYKMDGTPVAEKSTTGDNIYGQPGTLVTTVKSDKVAEGTVVNSSVKSDNFGFMCHANGSDNTNKVELLKGTEIDAGNAIFLVKKVNADLTVDGATLKSGNNVILQMMDNDDDFVGLDFAANWGVDDAKYSHTYGSHMPTFNQKLVEEAGWGYEWSTYEGSGKERTNDWKTNISLSDGEYTGNLFNGTGYSAQAAVMNVTIKEGTTLNGAISATATQHEVKEFTSANPENLGHVINTNYYNGQNDVNVTVEAGAVWNVTAESILTSLTNNGTVNGTITENADGTITVAPLAQ